MASTLPAVSLNNAASTGVGVTVDFLTAKKNVTAVVTSSARLLDGMVTVEASQDTVNWVALRSCAMADMESMAVSLTGVAFRYWRANLVRAAVGGTLRVTFMEAD